MRMVSLAELSVMVNIWTDLRVITERQPVAGGAIAIVTLSVTSRVGSGEPLSPLRIPGPRPAALLEAPFSPSFLTRTAVCRGDRLLLFTRFS